MSIPAHTLLPGWQAMGLPSRYMSAPANPHLGWTPTSCSFFSPRSSLCEYLEENRNMKKLKDPGEWVTGNLGWKGDH